MRHKEKGDETFSLQRRETRYTEKGDETYR